VTTTYEEKERTFGTATAMVTAFKAGDTERCAYLVTEAKLNGDHDLLVTILTMLVAASVSVAAAESGEDWSSIWQKIVLMGLVTMPEDDEPTEGAQR